MTRGTPKNESTDFTDYTDESEGNKPLPEAVQFVKSVDAVRRGGMERRDALKAMGAALTTLPVLSTLQVQGPAAQGTPMTSQIQGSKGGPAGGAWDPDLLHPRKDWPRKLSATELLTLSALCDSIIPADARSPSASAVGVPAWINEYVSAPLEGQQRDLVRIRGGLAWLNLESMKRFGKSFRQSRADQRAQICEDICYLPKARPEFQAAARFFDQVRDLAAVGFYTTLEGMRDLGYIGNVALPKFPEASAEVRTKLGL
jgi:gluconate 2-dehydrogenase gamma chain